MIGMDSVRNITHTSKVSFETKTELQRLSKDCGISSGDILENYVNNKSNMNAHEILLKMNMLNDRLEMIERLEKEQNKVLNYLKEEHKYILGQIKQLDNLKPNDKLLMGDKEENVKSTVKAFFDIRKQHTDSYGIIDSNFDAIKVGKTLCGRYDVNHDTFSKSIELIENGLDMDEFLEGDLSLYGVM